MQRTLELLIIHGRIVKEIRRSMRDFVIDNGWIGR